VEGREGGKKRETEREQEREREREREIATDKQERCPELQSERRQVRPAAQTAWRQRSTAMSEAEIISANYFISLSRDL